MIRNLTPHPVMVAGRTIPADPAGPARLAVTTVPAGEHEGIPLTRSVYGAPTGLPDPVEGTMLVVSQLVFNACPDRQDMCVPAEVVRDADGNITGCRSLGVR